MMTTFSPIVRSTEYHGKASSREPQLLQMSVELERAAAQHWFSGSQAAKGRL